LGQAAYFVTYESILRQIVRKDQKVSDAPLWASLLGGIENNILGGLAGVSFFAVAYPLDYMKTLMQTDDF